MVEIRERLFESDEVNASVGVRKIVFRSLEAKLPTIWTDGKATCEESRRRRKEVRRSEKRKRKKKEDAGARKR